MYLRLNSAELVAMLVLFATSCLGVMDVPLNDEPQIVNVHLILQDVQSRAAKNDGANVSNNDYHVSMTSGRNCRQNKNDAEPSFGLSSDCGMNEQVQYSIHKEDDVTARIIKRKRRRQHIVESNVVS